jgi:hypothetical protein
VTLQIESDVTNRLFTVRFLSVICWHLSYASHHSWVVPAIHVSEDRREMVFNFPPPEGATDRKLCHQSKIGLLAVILCLFQFSCLLLWVFHDFRTFKNRSEVVYAARWRHWSITWHRKSTARLWFSIGLHLNFLSIFHRFYVIRDFTSKSDRKWFSPICDARQHKWCYTSIMHCRFYV